MCQVFKKRPRNEINLRYFITPLEGNVLAKDIPHTFSENENQIVYNINRTLALALAIKINVLSSQRYLSRVKLFEKSTRYFVKNRYH